MPMPASIPTPPPSYVRTDTRVAETFERRKLEVDLRKLVEHDLLHIVKDVQIVRDTILNSQSTESGRERTQREYEESMNNIRTLAQEEFTRLLRQETSERKRALGVVDYNSVDVPRQQQWFPDNTCEVDDQRTPLISPSASKNAEGDLSISPQQPADGERVSDERSEGGYGSTVADGEPDGSKGKATAGEGKAEGVEGDNNPQLSPSSIPTQCPHSKSPISRKKSFSSPRPPSTSKLAGDNDDEDSDNTREHPTRRHANRPYSPGQTPSPGPQPPAWGSNPPTSEPSGISLAFVRANGQAYSTSSSAGLHRTGSLNLDQHCGSSVAHSDTELPPVPNHDPIASNFTLCERGNSAPSSPHNVSCPSTWPTVLLRTITYDTYLFPDDTRQGIAIPRIHTNPEEGPRRTSWGSLRSRPSFDDCCVYQFLTSKGDSTLPPALSATPDSIHFQLDDQQGMHSLHSLHSRRSMRSLQSIEPEHIVEAKRLEADARQAEAFAKMHEAAAQKKEAEAKRKEAEAKKREAEAQHKLEAARQRELEARRKEEEAKKDDEQASKREEEARRKEEDARRREDAARRRLDDALQQEMLARQIEEDARICEEKVRKEEEEEAMEEQLRTQTKEERIDHRPTQEIAPRQPPGSSRHERKEATAEDPARLEASKADVANRSAEVVEIAAPRQKKRIKAHGRAQAKRQRHEELEELRRKELEQQRLEEERFLEEKRRKEMLQRQREEQIRLDEELSRREQARFDREASSGILGQERLRDAAQEKEAIRVQGGRRRVAEERRRVAEPSHQRDSPRWQHQRQPDETLLRQRARGQPQREFERKEAVYYQRTTERERPGASFDLRVPHPPAGPTITDGGNPGGVDSTASPSVGLTALNHLSHTGPSNATNSLHTASATPKPPPASTRPAPGAWRIPYSTTSKREQERVESERRAKIAKAVPEKKSTDYTKAGGNSSTTATPWLDYLRMPRFQPFVRAKGGGDATRTATDQRAHAVHPRRP